jgi:hypothetical protein
VSGAKRKAVNVNISVSLRYALCSMRSDLALGTRFSRFQFFVIGVCVLHLTQLEVIIAVSQDIS